MSENVQPQNITIAITVYDRREYLEQAIRSALAQTLPAQVMVVEDCGPAPGLQSFVRSRFGDRLAYYRNPARRGLFGNWNACIERCTTPWLCLLHDDDFLEPTFVESMVELASALPGCGLYYARVNIVDRSAKVLTRPLEPPQPIFTPTDLLQAAVANPVLFPAALFSPSRVQELGGFRTTSQFTGDWDMWFKLAARFGAAGSSRVVGNSRVHHQPGRGTMRVVRNGRFLPLIFMQAKKNLALLRAMGRSARLAREAALAACPVSTRFLLENAAGFSPRFLNYYVRLLLQSKSVSPGHWLFKTATRFLGPAFVRNLSRARRTLRAQG